MHAICVNDAIVSDQRRASDNVAVGDDEEKTLIAKHIHRLQVRHVRNIKNLTHQTETGV